MPGVGRRLATPLVACPDAVLAHRSLNALLAGRESSGAQFAHPPWRAISALEFGVDGLNPGQHLRVRQPLAIRYSTVLPGLRPADTDVQNGTGLRQSIGPAMLVNPGILHSASLAKSAVAS